MTKLHHALFTLALPRAHPRGAVVTTDLPTPGAVNKYSNPRAAR